MTTPVRQLFPLLLAIGVAACMQSVAPGGDKAGAPAGPTTLRMATVDQRGRPDTPAVEHFAGQVAELSSGRLLVDVTWQAAPDETHFEQAIIEQVRSGEFDLGWVGSRAWDTEQVTTLQALQAPFLITDYGLLEQVVISPMAAEMLAGLDAGDVVGLGLIPDQLRHAVGLTKPLLSLTDFEGARIRVPTSNASDLLIRALGGEPVHVGGSAGQTALANGEIDGIDASLGFVPIPTVGAMATSNIVLYPRVNTLFANRDLIGRLSDDDRTVLREAAARTLDFAVAALPAAEDSSAACAAGHHVLLAAGEDVAAIVEAGSSVYVALRKDQQTADFIDQIEALKASAGTPPAPAPACSPAGSTPQPTSTASAPVDAAIEGTWETPRLTREKMAGTLAAAGLDPDAVGMIAENEGFREYMVYKVEIRNGRWTIFGFPDGTPAGVGWAGTYKIVDSETVTATEGPCTIRYRYEVSDDELTLEILGDSCDPTGRNNFFQTVIFESAPFKRAP
jgi:TRAP-type C4-dicarboxylate transport system substrate-binding protein